MAHADPPIDSGAALFMLFLLIVSLLQPIAKLSETYPLIGVIERMVGSAMAWEQEHGRWEGA